MSEALVVITADQLSGLIKDAVRDALGQAPQNTNQYMTLEQAAAMFQCDPKTVRAWVKSNGLPALRVGREFRFRRDSVLEWLEAQAVRDGAHVDKHVRRIRALKKA